MPSNETHFQAPPSTSFYVWRGLCIAMLVGFASLFAFFASTAPSQTPFGKVVFAGSAAFAFFVIGVLFMHDLWAYHNRRLTSTELQQITTYPWNESGKQALIEVCEQQTRIRVRHLFQVQRAHFRQEAHMEEQARASMEKNLRSKFSPPEMGH